MNVINPILAAVLATTSLSAIAGLSANLMPAEGSARMDGFNAQLERDAARRKQMVDFMVSMGESSAKSGISYSRDEWLELYQSVRSFGTPSFTIEFLEVLRKTQNAQAEQTRQKR